MPDLPRARCARPLRACLAALLIGCLGVSCASLPTSGPVRAGRDVSVEDRQELAAPIFAAAPRVGSEPRDIVRGFLAASVDFHRDHETARLYLDPGVQDGWNPESGTTVYRFTGEGSIEVLDVPPEGAEAGVRLTADVVGRIDEEGKYFPAPPGERLEIVFGLRQVGGEWRISTVPGGLLLTPLEVDETYRRLDLYFLDPDRRVVVPDPVFIPAQAGLATALVRRLLRGPTSVLAPAVTTAFPAGSQLAVTPVVFDDAVAEVVLDAAALAADVQAREQMAAQMVWTLGQLPQVTAVRLRAGQSDLGRADSQGRQTRADYASYDPSGLGSSTQPVVVDGGVLAALDSLTGGELTPLEGSLGDPGVDSGLDSDVPLRRPAPSLDGSRVAGLDPAGRTLLVGRVGSDDEAVSRFAGEDLAPPSWTVGPWLYVVDRGSDPGLWVVPPEAEAQRVELPDFGPARLVAARPSRDGTRIALVLDDPAVPAPPEALATVAAQEAAGRVLGDRLLIGVIRRSGSGDVPSIAVENAREVAYEVGAITDLAWAEPTEVVVLADVYNAPAQPVVVSVDGYVVSVTSVLPGLVSITAAAGSRPLLGATSEGQIMQYSGRRWTLVGPGSQPAYPG